MALTTEQLAALKADILADAAFNDVPMTPDGHYQIAAAYNVVSSTFYVWKTSVTTDQVIDTLVWTEYLVLTLAQRQTLEFMLSNHDFNPSLPNVRQGIAACLPTGSADASRAALLSICSQLATRAEELFAVSGTGTEASPATRGFIGQLQYQDVEQARLLA